VTGLRTQVVRDLAELLALESAWAALYAGSVAATPFQTHGWVTAWAAAYVPPQRLFVVLVWQDGRLVAAAPLYRRGRGRWAVLAPLGGAISDHTDVLVEAGAEAAVWPVLTAALLDEPGWALLDLPEVRPDASVRGWSAVWPGSVAVLSASSCLELPVLPIRDLLARMPGRTANTMRRKLRKVDAAGVEVRRVPPADVPGAVDDLLRLHEEQWAGRNGTAEHFTGRFRAHLTDALRRMVGAGKAAVVEYRVDGDLVIAQVLLLGRDTLSYYLAGIAPRLRQRVDTAAVIVRHDIEMALEQGCARYSMLRGEEDYKTRWRADVVRQERLLLARPGPVGTVRALLADGTARSIQGVKTWAPWVQSVRSRLKGAPAPVSGRRSLGGTGNQGTPR
jgi:CelD/BcsL family acetyltransferase involved in cellulose biosynthesis